MKKVISLKEIMVILISVIVIAISTSSFATDVLGAVGGTNNTTTITGNEYDSAQTPETDNNTINNITNNTANNTTTNKAKTYNTSNNTTDLPQTGIEDYNIGILLVICVASAIFAYKKINDYKNI